MSDLRDRVLDICECREWNQERSAWGTYVDEESPCR